MNYNELKKVSWNFCFFYIFTFLSFLSFRTHFWDILSASHEGVFLASQRFCILPCSRDCSKVPAARSEPGGLMHIEKKIMLDLQRADGNQFLACHVSCTDGMTRRLFWLFPQRGALFANSELCPSCLFPRVHLICKSFCFLRSSVRATQPMR